MKIDLRRLEKFQKTRRLNTCQRCKQVGVSNSVRCTEALLIISTVEIQFMFSKAPTSQIPLLSELLPDAIQNSRQWRKERELGEPTTDCFTTMIPIDPDQDISISLWVGRREGLQMNEMAMLQRTWSAWHSHSSLQPHSPSELKSSGPR